MLTPKLSHGHTRARQLTRELTPLLGGKIHFHGYEMECDDERWHWCIVFPLKHAGNSQEWSRPMSQASRQARKIFTELMWREIQEEAEVCGNISSSSMFRDNMTKEEFHAEVRQQLLKLLSGSKCGFKLQSKISIDEDEIFLLIELAAHEAQRQIADWEEIRMPVSADAYPGNKKCPTIEYSEGNFIGDTYAPIYMPYQLHYDSKFQAFKEIELIRLIRNRMMEYVDLEELEASGIMIKMFPVHKWMKLKKFEDQGWSRVCACCQCPSGRSVDEVREYFGEEVAFFFDWFNYYTRMLFLPALIGAVIFFRRFVLEKTVQRCVAIGFAAFMCFWSSYFTSAYQQHALLKSTQWGMKDWNTVEVVRSNYREERRGTLGEKIQNGLHWFLASIFMLETVAAVAWINAFRIRTKAHPDQLFFWHTRQAGWSVCEVSHRC